MVLDIAFSDQWIVAVNKPAGLLSCPGERPKSEEGDSAMKLLRDQLGAKVWQLHRLDQPTSGILLFALSAEIASRLRTQFDEQKIKKCYSAVVIGQTEVQQWSSTEKLQKDESKPLLEARTDFTCNKTVEINDEVFSVLQAHPHTGRFHQIRKHLAMANLPIVGDYLYGDIEQMNRIAELIGQQRMMLHAQSISINHPMSDSPIQINSTLPDRFRPFY